MHLITRLTVYLCCSFGCGYQVSQILTSYLNYTTSSELTIKLPDAMRPRDLSLCQRYVDIFDYGKFFKDRNISFAYDVNDPVEKKMKLSPLATLRDLLNYTPHRQTYIISCFVRHPNSYSGAKLNGSDRFEVFKVNRFILQDFICYDFHLKPHENDTYRFRPLKYSLDSLGTFFILELAETRVKLSIWMKFIAHSKGSYPAISAGLAPDMKNKYDTTLKRYDFNSVDVTFTYLKMHKLPPPYTTMCGMLGEHKSDCISKCIVNLTLDKYNKLPFSVILTSNDANRTIINSSDLNDYINELDYIESMCSKRCLSDDCEEVITMTKVFRKHIARKNFSIWFKAPNEIVFDLCHSPRHLLSELLLYVFSSICTWMGVSLLGLSTALLGCCKRTRVNGTIHRRGVNVDVMWREIHRLKANDKDYRVQIRFLSESVKELRYALSTRNRRLQHLAW